MKPQVAPGHEWRPHLTRMAMRGRVVLRLKPGWAPERIASHAVVLHGMAQAAARIDRGPLDRAVSRFSPRMRVTRAFEAARTAGTPRAHTGWDDTEAALGLSRVLRLEVDPDASVVALVDALRQLDVVESASPHYLCQAPFAAAGYGLAEQPGDPPRDWGPRMIGAARALREEPGDTALITAIVDSGIALDHPEFAGRIRPGADLVDMPAGQISRAVSLFGDTDGRDTIAMDEVGHGSACAGLIGARGLDTAPGTGGACRLLPIRCLAGAFIAGNDEPTALGAIPDIDAGVKRAVDLGARVLNLSFGTPASALAEGDPVPHAEVVRYALARGCLLVAASGNSGDRTRYYPAALDGVITVGAVGPAGHPTAFSTRGDHVDLSAPGLRIHAPAVSGYDRVTGTSFAAPFVTGACALLVARGHRRSAPVGPALAREVLRASARPFPASAEADGCGTGILDIPAALAHLDRILGQSAWPTEHLGRPRTYEFDSAPSAGASGVHRSRP